MTANNKKDSRLAGQARELFAEQASGILPELAKLLLEKVTAMLDQPGSAAEIQDRRDAWQSFRPNGAAWVRGTAQAWQRARLLPDAGSPPRFQSDSTKFELLDNEEMEGKIIASRLALRLLDFGSWELNDLRLRIQNLEGMTELHKDDIFRPEVLSRHLVEQWTKAKLSRELWITVQDIIQKRVAEHLLVSYHAANEFLIQNGVMAEIDLRPLVKRTPSAVVAGKAQARGANASDEPNQGGSFSGALENGKDSAGYGGGKAQVSINNAAGRSGASPGGNARADYGSNQGNQSYGGGRGMEGGNASSAGAGRNGGGGNGGNVGGGSGGGSNANNRGGASTGRDSNTNDANSAGLQERNSGSSGNAGNAGNATFDETRMQTATTPLAKARMRAQGVMGHLRRLLSNQVAGFDDTRSNQTSPQLAQAFASIKTAENSDDRVLLSDNASAELYGPEQVEQVASALRQRTSTLKKAASTSTEKATIEIVALMFQSILAEDRIPPAVRVWFARLQMPVLRVALSEPEFFGSLQHPARRLIDRMGSCVLGFDVDVSGGAMEAEIKRIVQVIEQYPETGRRVFQLVYDEFQKFLSKFLSEQGSAARVVSVAQQVEQKETMAIQYTIEMRNMLNDMPVRDEIREFLFKIWAEVLAIAAMRNGPQHAETITLKRAAADLVWAASAKPNRNDRAKVIADLPKLLQLLRAGMSMLNMSAKGQDQHIKVISDTLADAFMSKTDPISLERIDAMAKRLANLEDYLSDEDVGDLPLDTESLVTMIGIDASDIEVITDGGSQPTEAMRAWAQELQVGAWFSLDHNSRVSHVQFAWRSDRKQLHLFASADGRNFLIQARRLAAYLQAGLLVPTEDEALTVRATREALAKLDANPERLLG